MQCARTIALRHSACRLCWPQDASDQRRAAQGLRRPAKPCDACLAILHRRTGGACASTVAVGQNASEARVRVHDRRGVRLGHERLFRQGMQCRLGSFCRRHTAWPRAPWVRSRTHMPKQSAAVPGWLGFAKRFHSDFARCVAPLHCTSIRYCFVFRPSRVGRLHQESLQARERSDGPAGRQDRRGVPIETTAYNLPF